MFIAENNLLFAQNSTIKNSITIKNNNNSQKEDYYKTAIYKANMESYRLRDKEVTLLFSEGFECVLLSAKALSEKGIQIDVGSYQTDFSSNFIMPVFSITVEGNIVAMYQKVGK